MALLEATDVASPLHLNSSGHAVLTLPATIHIFPQMENGPLEDLPFKLVELLDFKKNDAFHTMKRI